MKSTKTTQTELGQHSCRESDYSGGNRQITTQNVIVRSNCWPVGKTAGTNLLLKQPSNEGGDGRNMKRDSKWSREDGGAGNAQAHHRMYKHKTKQ